MLAGGSLAEAATLDPLEGGGIIQKQDANIHSEQHDEERPTWYADEEGQKFFRSKRKDCSGKSRSSRRKVQT
ncbi:hypothetical protein D3C87_2011770 [compost metagenome]